MTRSLHIIFVFLVLNCPFALVNGQIPVGTWRDHLSWNTAEKVVMAGSKVYCSNGVGICVYDPSDRSLEKLTKANGLSEAGVTALQYAASTNMVIVGYDNGNMDIIAGNNIYNISEIKRNNLYAEKQINHIYESGSRAYLSCSFGIVAIDLSSRQIIDTYIIGDGGTICGVYSLTEYKDEIYAATDHGIKKADRKSPVLTDFSVWKKVENIPENTQVFKQIISSDNALYICDLNNIVYFHEDNMWKNLSMPFAGIKIHGISFSQEKLLVNASGAVYIYNGQTNLLQTTIESYNNKKVIAFDAMMDQDGSCWIADNQEGLVQWKSANAISFHLLNGPSSNNSTVLRFKTDRLLCVSGGKDQAGAALNRQGEIHTFYSNQWSSIHPAGAYDFTDVDISPDRPETYYVSSWGDGLYVFESGIPTLYNQYNSPLTADYSGKVYCGGVLMDNDSRLWVSNDKKINILSSGQWTTAAWQSQASMGRLTEDNYQQIWTTLQDNGLRAFAKTSSWQGQSNGTRSFYPYNYTQSAAVRRSNSIANTPDGIMWIGTEQGPVYYNDPSGILEAESTGGQHPIRTGTDEPSHLYALLGSEEVLSVAIDGAYRKWFGTRTGGVFLIAEDKVSEVRHFTVDNSPLFSNEVYDIAINDKTGEVFFATKYGIVSYRSDAVSSGEDFGKVYAFPNPVRPDYHGEITITGLIKDADVKITDVAGNLVYQTRTLGGQAVWNGCNRQGRRVASGVYLVFCTNDDGSKTHITKILFIR